MLMRLSPVARLPDMQREVWVTASCRMNWLTILLISCTHIFSQRKVLSEIWQVCGEIKDIHLRMKEIRVSSLENFLLTGVRTLDLPAHR